MVITLFMVYKMRGKSHPPHFVPVQYLCNYGIFFIISTANQIVNAGFIIICKADQHFDWNVPGASFVVGVGTLADVKDITDLLLGQIRVCPKVLNSLKFHRFTSFSSVESAGTKCNEQRKPSVPESFQKV